MYEYIPIGIVALCEIWTKKKLECDKAQFTVAKFPKKENDHVYWF